MISALLEPLLPEGSWRHQFLRARGARFHLARHGPEATDAPLVLLLPEVGRTWWSWRHVLALLGAAGVPVAALDPRGVGASDRTPTGYALPEVTADLAGVLDALGQHRTVLVGHGWGGLTALALAAAEPRLVSSLVLVAAPAPAALQGYRRLVRTAVLGARVLTPRRLHRWTSADHLEPDAPCRVALREWPGPERALAPLRAAARHPAHLRVTPSEPDVPTTVVRSARDPLLPRPGPSSARTTVLDAGHQLPEECPEELVELLLRVARTVRVRPGTSPA